MTREELSEALRAEALGNASKKLALDILYWEGMDVGELSMESMTCILALVRRIARGMAQEADSFIQGPFEHSEEAVRDMAKGMLRDVDILRALAEELGALKAPRREDRAA
ncbi:MAG: hypothetical protein JWM10_3004 [Myxococcaceae bacterium]|nr:hypothetical protein [Myxococcaceae bacterium]